MSTIRRLSKLFGVLLALTLLFSAMPVGQAKAQSTLCVNADGLGGCYTSIQSAIDAASDGDTINVAAGTYVEDGQIVIDNNLTITGEDKATTIIKPAQDTGSSGDSRGWFLVTEGVNFNLSNVTLDGEGKQVHQAIRSFGSGTIDNNIIKNITYDSYYGLGAVVMGDYNMTISNNTLSNIGRIGMMAYGSGVTDAQFIGNTYTGKGDGDYLDYGIEIGGGAKATITGNTISGIGDSTTDWSSAAILVTDAYPTNGPAAVTITNNTLANNYRGIHVGHGTSDGVIVVAENNNLAGTGEAIITTTDLVNLVDGSPNWFGNIAGPADNQIVGNVVYNPWCGDSECTFTVPDGNGVIELSGHINIPGGIVVDQPGLTFLLKDETVIENDSPCFVVNADNTTIKAENNGEAVCVAIGDGFSGIEVADGVTGVTIQGLEITGDGSADQNGIEFQGAVTDLQIVDNFIHDLTGDGIFFTQQPQAQSANGLFIQGNLIKNAGVAINNSAGSSEINAEFNAWGDYNGRVIGNVDTDPYTYVDLYMSSSGTPWEDRVVSGQSITYFVKALMQNVTAADFTLSYPEAILGNPVINDLTDLFDVVPGKTGLVSLDPGVISFDGYTGTAVSGDIVLFSVTFDAIATGTGTLDFDETTDLFAMSPGYGPSVNIYADSLEDRDVTVVALPELSSDDIQGYYLTGEPRDFSVKTVNPADGADYSNVIFNYTIYNAALSDIASFTYAGGDMPLTQDGTNLVGYFGPVGGFAMTAPYDVTTTFNIEFNTAGDYDFELTLVDLSADPDFVLATLTDTAEVYDAPTMTPDIPATFMSDEQVEFSVNLSNPATGIETNVYAEIVLTGLIPADIQSLQYFEVADGQWHDLVYNYDSVSGEITIHYGPAAGFPMTAPYDVDALFRVIFNNNVNLGFAYTGTLYDYDFDPDRGLATMSGSSTVYANFDVTGTVSMQGRTVRSGVQMVLDGLYDLYLDISSSLISLNLGFEDVIADTYLITTVQDRYLNITSDLGIMITIGADAELPALELKGGNADNDMDIDINDASLIGAKYGTGTIADAGDVNFDNRVNIQDLALVGGNFDLTAATAYGTWLP